MNKKIKYLIISLLLFSSLFLLNKSILADRQLDDYLFQYEKYRNLHDEFVSARNKYLQYKTLATRDQALTVNKEIAWQRDEVLRTYLVLLRKRVNESLISPVSLKEDMQKELEKQISWFSEHQKKIKYTEESDYEEIFKLVKETEDDEAKIYKTIYKSLLLIKMGRIQEAQQESVFLREDMTNYTQQTGNYADFQFWLDTVQQKNRNSENLNNQARELMFEFEEKETMQSIKSLYLEIKDILQKSLGELERSYSFHSEIFREVSKSE